VYGLELGRSVRRVQGRGHIVAASRLQLISDGKLMKKKLCKHILSHYGSFFRLSIAKPRYENMLAFRSYISVITHEQKADL